MQKIRFFILMVFLVAGCSPYPKYAPGTIVNISEDGVVEELPVSIPAPTAGEIEREYLVGPGDVLGIFMPGMKTRIANDLENQPQGYRVYSSGKVLLPMVGGVLVAGLSVDQVQEKLQKAFSPYVHEPVITVEVLEYKSQALYLLGKFNQPGVQYLDRPVNLLQGIALGSGLQESANLRGARLVRENRIVPVDIYELIYDNDLRQNVVLNSGDTIFIPGNDQQNVFVLGSVVKEGPIPMLNGRLSLPQALASAGLGEKSHDLNHIRIIRSHSPTKGVLMVADLDSMMAGQSMPLALQDGDIVYVPRNAIGDWNVAIKEMLPTLQAFGAVLQPFVQIKYLMDDDD